MDLSDEDKCKKNDDDKDDRNRDANQDGSVIRVSADRLRPWSLTELVRSSVSTDLKMKHVFFFYKGHTKKLLYKN